MGQRAIGICGAVLAAALALPLPARERVLRERIEYQGWRGAWRLSNGTVDLVFVPQIGRIMRYGFIGDRNVLWENPRLLGRIEDALSGNPEWVNFGGDKLWPAPQERWRGLSGGAAPDRAGWPPDPVLDRGENEVLLLDPARLLVRGPASLASGVRFEREIRLDEHGTGVTIRNRMRNAGDAGVEWSIWEVAQVAAPDEACLPLARSRPHPEGYYVFPGSAPVPEMLTAAGGRVCLRRHPERGAKIGTGSPQGWAEARLGDLRFRISAEFERGARYPDNGCGQEVWSNPDPDAYMELELLSPIRKLDPGETVGFPTRWTLTRGEPGH